MAHLNLSNSPRCWASRFLTASVRSLLRFQLETFNYPNHFPIQPKSAICSPCLFTKFQPPLGQIQWMVSSHSSEKKSLGPWDHLPCFNVKNIWTNHQLGTNMSHLGKLEKSSTQKCLFKRGYVGSQDSTLKKTHLSTTMQWRWHHYSLDASAVKNESFVGHDPFWFSKCQQIIKAFPVPTISMIQQYHFIAMGNSSN